MINNIYKQILNKIQNSRYILITTHINPDADTICSALALSNYFYNNKIKHKVFNQMDTLPKNFDFLNKFDKITHQLPKFYDLVIYVDCASKDRIGLQLDNNIPSINIDHHFSNTNFATINLVDSSKISATEVLYHFFEKNNLTITKDIAQCLYTGLYDDSLKFSSFKVEANSFNIASKLVLLGANPNFVANNLNQRETLAKYRLLPKILNSLELHLEGKIATIYLKDIWLQQTGANYRECENIVDMILNIQIVQIAIFFRVSNNTTRVSFRSKNDDVSIIAKAFGGGGHKMASGCDCDTVDIFEAKSIILDYIKDKNAI
jgi:phosphoesterase RecJ-like protein